MEKLIHSSDAQDALLEQAGGALVFLFENGQQIKSASSSAVSEKLMRDNMPDEKHFGVHLIAMGAGENYGWNRNGDHFPEQELKDRHHTFVKNGHMFREHRNKKSEQAIGNVKASTYNDEMARVELIVHGSKEKAAEEYGMVKQGKGLSWSMSCFPAGSLVTMADGSEKPIEQIVEGEQVLTHKGNIGTVSKTMARHYTGRGIKFLAAGAESVVCTEDHGIWHRPVSGKIKDCPVCGLRCKSLTAHLWQKKDIKHQAAWKDAARYMEGFTAAGNLLPGDVLRQPFLRRSESGGNSDWAVVVGYYLAEGSLSVVDVGYTRNGKYYGPYKDSRVELVFHKDENAMVKEFCDAVERLGFSRPSVFHKPDGAHPNAQKAVSHSKTLHDWLLHHCGKYSHAKALSEELMNWPLELKKVMLEKWLEGDGTWHKQHNKFQGTTVSQRLARQWVEIATHNGIASTTHKDIKQAKRKKKHDPYIISFTGKSAEALMVSKKPYGWAFEPLMEVRNIGHLNFQTSTKTCVQRKPAPATFVENGFLYRKVLRVQAVFLDETVYDLTVPGDHGFVVNGLGVSNCRVAGDTCSCCSKFATKSANYCDHAKHQMTKWIPEFSKFAYVINKKPTFFDISRVGYPADRIAHHIEYMMPAGEMAKAASAAEVITSAARAETAHLQLPIELSIGAGTPSRQRWLEKLAALEEKVASLQRQPDNSALSLFLKHAAAHAFPDFTCTDAEFEQLQKVEPAVLFNKLASRGAVLPLNCFAALYFKLPLAQAAEHPLTKAAVAQLPTVFRRLRDEPSSRELEELFVPASNYKTACWSGDPIDGFLDQMGSAYSVQPERVRVRIICATTLPTLVIKSAAMQLQHEGLGKQLADAYGFYKLAFVDYAEQNLSRDFVDEPAQVLLVSNHLI